MSCFAVQLLESRGRLQSKHPGCHVASLVYALESRFSGTQAEEPRETTRVVTQRLPRDCGVETGRFLKST